MEKHFCDVCGTKLKWNAKSSSQLEYTIQHHFADEYGIRYITVCSKCKPLVIKAIEDVKNG